MMAEERIFAFGEGFGHYGDNREQRMDAARRVAEAIIAEAVAAMKERCVAAIKGGYFLHDDAPTARFAREVVAMLERLS